MKKVIGIIGSGGLIGSELVKFLSADFEIRIIKSSLLHEDARVLALSLDGIDVIVNLAGYPIAGRWNHKVKNQIYNSRINTTKNLILAITLLERKPLQLINASAVGIYSDQELSDESSRNFAGNFLSKVVIDWEKEASCVLDLGVKLSIARFGVVLSNSGGAFKILRKVFELGIGGVIGSGKQGFSFILIEDVLKIFHLIISRELVGVINLVCPRPVTNAEFSRELARSLRRPCFFTIPSFVLQMVFREGSSTLLEGQKVISARLQTEGYRFIGNNLKDCLNILVK